MHAAELSVMAGLVPAIHDLISQKTCMPATSAGMTKEQSRRESARRELQELDRVEVLHASADALGRVEQHIGLGAERIAQHAHALAIHHQIAATEIAERDRVSIRRYVRHVLGLDHRKSEQARAPTRLQRRRPQILPVGILEFANRSLRL